MSEGPPNPTRRPTQLQTLVGGMADDSEMAVADPGTGLRIANLQYAVPDVAENTYKVEVQSSRLDAVLVPGDNGWIARAPMLNALGYGDTTEQAIVDLCDSIEQYLEFLRDDQPKLGASVAHHAAYVRLLDSPRLEWFRSVSMPASQLSPYLAEDEPR